MPRKSQFPPPIKFHRSTGCDRCWVTGRGWVSLGPSGSDRAKQAYARLVAELSAGAPVAHPQRTQTGAPTVGAVIAAWLAHPDQEHARSAKEMEQYRLSLRPLDRLYGNTPATDFRARHLEAVQLAMATGSWLTEAERLRYETLGFPIGLSANVVNRRIVRLRTVWRWAEAHDLVPAGGYTHLLAVAGLRKGDQRARHTPGVRPARWDDVRAVARRCPPVVRSMLIVQWWTGMRSEEVRTMRAGDVDASGEVWRYTPRGHKMAHKGQPRTVALGPKARAALAPWLAQALASPQGADAYLFPPEPGRLRRRKDGSASPRPPYDHRRCYSDMSFPRAVARAAERAGVIGFFPYRTRHAAKDRITRLAGADAARAVLGQSSINTTSHYGSLDAEHAAETQRRLG
jgi:integrase